MFFFRQNFINVVIATMGLFISIRITISPFHIAHKICIVGAFKNIVYLQP